MPRYVGEHRVVDAQLHLSLSGGWPSRGKASRQIEDTEHDQLFDLKFHALIENLNHGAVRRLMPRRRRSVYRKASQDIQQGPVGSFRSPRHAGFVEGGPELAP